MAYETGGRSLVQARIRDEKIVHAIAFFARRGVTGLTKMMVAKLLYFADKTHLRRHGRLLTGDSYYCLDHGPVPSAAQNLMNGALGAEGGQDWAPSAPLFLSVLKVENEARGGRNDVFHARTEPDADVFSDSDLEVLEEVVVRHGPLSASELRGFRIGSPTTSPPRSCGAVLGVSRCPSSRSCWGFRRTRPGRSSPAWRSKTRIDDS